jgi:stearoyl-CoA desaturase (delta-9 desaturase)
MLSLKHDVACCSLQPGSSWKCSSLQGTAEPLIKSHKRLRSRLFSSSFLSFSPVTVRSLLILVHLIAFTALFFRPRSIDLFLFVFFYLATGFGVTIGFHRLLAHRGFASPGWLTAVLAFLGTASMQGGPLWWVGVHRKHHQVSDREGDPHSPSSSFVHAHMGWMFERKGLPAWPRLASDLSENKFLVWLDSGPAAAVPWITTLVICYMAGGMRGVIWGGAVRTVFVWHATWCVNSVCHRWGARPHNLREKSGNVWWVGLWALGEGWHNNHHAQPRAAIHTYNWWEIDVSGYLIAALERCGIVGSVIRSKPKAEVS